MNDARENAKKQVHAAKETAQKQVNEARENAKKQVHAAKEAAQKLVNDARETAQKQVHAAKVAAQKQVQAQVNQTLEGKSAVGLASVLGVSPTSMNKVVQGSRFGSLSSSTLEDAYTDETCKKPRFLKRVETVLTPVVERLCSSVKFKHGKTDVSGVAGIVLRKIARSKSAKARRQLNFTGRPRGVSAELHSLLQELAAAWRDAFRNGDRDNSARLLQLTLKAIPPRKGRVSDWLGPK